jgi:hypothetical protein
VGSRTAGPVDLETLGRTARQLREALATAKRVATESADSDRAATIEGIQRRFDQLLGEIAETMSPTTTNPVIKQIRDGTVRIAGLLYALQESKRTVIKPQSFDLAARQQRTLTKLLREINQTLGSSLE